MGETLIEAVYRECLEEIGAEIIVKDLIHIREYIGKNHEFAEWDSDIHQVEFYFLCYLKDSNSGLTNGSNPDSNQVAVEWIGLEKIDTVRVYPKALGIIIKNNIKSNIYIGDVK
ncbi:NUDIX domain-containing protein [Cohnella xylanilytica]|uniref:NUDIX domain-containing protein n=1 Tax=Cohnella xylanilytica TaxID=557555 RepID=UPI004063ABFF